MGAKDSHTFYGERQSPTTSSFPSQKDGLVSLNFRIDGADDVKHRAKKLPQDVDEFLLVFLDRLETQLSNLPQQRLLQHVFG